MIGEREGGFVASELKGVQMQVLGKPQYGGLLVRVKGVQMKLF